MIRVNDRDQRLLLRLRDYEVLSTSQIGRQLFEGVALSTVLRRLRKLEAEHFIFRQSARLGAQELWSIERAGAAVIGMKAPYPRLNRLSLFRACALSHLRDALEAQGVVDNWSSARELRAVTTAQKEEGSRSIMLPDAVFTLQNGDQPKTAFLKLAMETTSFPKNQKALSSFAKVDSLFCIWLVVESAELIPLLFAQWEGTYRPKQSMALFVSVLQELIDFGRRAKVFLSAEESILLTHLVDSKTVKNRSEDQTAEHEEGTLCP
jgi:hypothetical protein